MKAKNILFLLISLFIIVVAWVSFNIYHNAISSTIPEQLENQIIPIAPVFDTNTLEKLRSRQKISPLYQSIVPSVSPSPIPTSSPATSTPTPSITISVTPTASEGGTLQ